MDKGYTKGTSIRYRLEEDTVGFTDPDVNRESSVKQFNLNSTYNKVLHIGRTQIRSP